MPEIKVFESEVAGKKLKVEIGRLAKQAHGACTVSYGETVVLATVVQSPQPKEGTDFFPLLVDYEERLYAAGKIKGSRFIKREGRPTDEAILNARLIDRAIRPLFKDTERRDVQVVVTVLSVDQENDPDVPALLAASLALSISPVIWNGPLGAIRVGRIGGEWVLNPSYQARQKSDLDVFIAATPQEIVMLEAGAQEVPEEDIAAAIFFGHKHIGRLFPFLQEIIQSCAVAKWPEPVPTAEEIMATEALKAKVEAYLQGKFEALFATRSKEEYRLQLENIKQGLDETLKADNEVSKEARAKGVGMIDYYLDLAARRQVLDKGLRVDGRSLDQIRELEAEVGVLPRTHGSALFRRGETQVLSVVTLGSPGMEQTLESMEEEGKKRFMHHYNFPGFSVGEVRPVRSPGRREIGHGALVEKALLPVIPQDKAAFPYTIRIVSEVLSSNGSSSQASVCASSLALMDAGVPIKTAVAGIAMGLITDPFDKSRYAILTDIQGVEDHAGDMDFKVAGTKQGVTAIQLDIKLGGIKSSIIEEALLKARQARQQILEVMNKTLAAPRPELSPYAPRIVSFYIPVDKIREVIGPGGKVINEIIDATGVTIDIEDDGLVMVTSVSAEASQKAVEWIKNLTREVAVGEVFQGKVTRIMNFGAFVEILPRQEGLVHISELSWGYVKNVSDVVKVGDVIPVKVIEIDEQGRINLSYRQTQPKPDSASTARYGDGGNHNTNHDSSRRGGAPSAGRLGHGNHHKPHRYH